MFLVGLSGGIASVVEPGTPAYRQIVHHFGPGVLLESGQLDRQKLGAIVFSEPGKRQLLNSLTHPPIRRAMLRQTLCYFLLGYRYVILDIPLLFETRRMTRYLKRTVLIYCDPQTQLQRLRRRDGLSWPEARGRLAAQLPLADKIPLADVVVDNSGSRESARQQVLRLHGQLEASRGYLPARGVALALAAGVLTLAWGVFRRLWQ
ncbi:dephospho-CoA kinase domain-containing protein-like isoform X2 [Ascaphus truei]|uniref:dephospho-CoA kinase domain-containing protein-like isoform X2 n=1 Tax=Ascaphus truei TaxID=8439 RepID=UPI003F5A428D